MHIAAEVTDQLTLEYNVLYTLNVQFAVCNAVYIYSYAGKAGGKKVGRNKEMFLHTICY